MSSANFSLKPRKVIASRIFLLLFASLLAISWSIGYVVSEARPQERFLSISTLGSDMTTDNYYPAGNSAINVGDTVTWHVNVYNHMGSPEYLSVRIKLLNSTEAIPDDTSKNPDPDPDSNIIEMKHMLMDNSTWVFPLSWKIKDVYKEQDYVVIKSLSVNGIDVDGLNVKSAGSKDFRMIIELWRYDPEVKNFAFTWSSGLDERSAWNQIWFNVR
ncbi:MAG: hypothetical protein ACE5KA_02540 [Nitrososphaerales archaeon]